MNKMSLVETFEVGESGEPLKFVVKSTDPRHTGGSGSSSGGSSSGSGGGGSGGGGSGPSGAAAQFVCYGPSSEATAEWVETIKAILQSQRDFLKAIQSPIKYQHEQSRLSSGTGGTQYL